MMGQVKWLTLAACLMVIGCTNPTSYAPGAGAPGGEGSTGDSSGGAASGGDASAGGADNGTSGQFALTGTILPAGTAKRAPRSQTAEQAYTVVAQSAATGQIYRTATDAQGEFELELPAEEQGSSFMVTILGPEGRALGPVLFGEASGDGLTGLAPQGETSLGTIALPDDPGAEPIEPGADSELADLVDPDLTARLDANGVAVGLASHGKGQQAADESGNPAQPVDGDRDGLIELFDADDDGDGLVDDFEGDGDPGGLPDDLFVNFFMNLKIAAEQASTYYQGTSAQIDAALGSDTIITFEVMPAPGAARTIAGANLLETPGPAYLPQADKMGEGQNGLAFTPWADSNYAFDQASDRFQAFVRPNAVMDAGETFTVAVTFGDGTTGQYSRMINYVFKNIPRLVRYGAPGALNDFDVSDTSVNGSASHPIPFDGSQDLVLVFNPPPDETGAYLTALGYTFQIFYNSAADGSQLNGQIDINATWPTRPEGFDGATYRVSAEALTLSADDTYTVTLPRELFPDSVQLQSSGQQTLGSYKIDITAECPSGNAAIMLIFRKQ